MICTTLNKIRDLSPCEDRWKKLLKHLNKTEADDEALPLLTVLDSNGIDDCLWCLRTVPEHNKEWRLYAVWCARQVQHLMNDPRSIVAIDVAEQFANGQATKTELSAAGAAAWAAWDARGAAGAAASAAVGAAAGAAAWAAGDAAEAADAAARAAARAAQEIELRRILS